MQNRAMYPETIAPPQGAYAHAVEIAEGSRIAYISGQVGIDRDGNVPADFRAQAEIAWANVMTVLKAAGMGPEHIVHYTSYLVAGTDSGPYDAARMKALGDARPASTKVYVAGLARPELLCEVQAFACAPAGDEPVV